MCNDSSSSYNNNNKGNVTTAEMGIGIEIEIEVCHQTAVTTINAGISSCRGKGRDSGLGTKTSQHRINRIKEGISKMKEGISRMKEGISRTKGEISGMKEGINRIRDTDRDDMIRSLSTNKAPNSIRDLGKMTRLIGI